MKIDLFINGKLVYTKDDSSAAAADPSNAEKIFTGFDYGRGVKEYDGIVGAIQKWYYGDVVKGAWCATSMSYFAYKAGCLASLGGKNENVFEMMEACKLAGAKGYGTFYEKNKLPDIIPQYAICFFLWSGDKMTANSSKHVCMAEYASSGPSIYCIGGNQNDKICTKEYSRDKLYAIYCIN